MQLKLFSVLLTAVFLLAGCTSTRAPEDARLEVVEGAISSLSHTDGVVYLGIGPGARSFVIHPDLSPDADALKAFALQESKTKTKLSATVWIRADIGKANPETDEPWPWVIVDLKKSE